MADFYYVNNDQTRNPGLHHEVHTEKCTNSLGISNKTYVGFFSNEVDAVAKVKSTYYSDADGCAICCPQAHKG